MKLLIVSHTPHYQKDGITVGWGPTVREVDQLARIFDSVTHVAPLHPGTPPASAIAYESCRVRLRPVPPSGGAGLRAKADILLKAPVYLRAVLGELRAVDVAHVRCPAHISLMAIVLLALMRAPGIRWAKYAGNWQPRGRESPSYTLQRWCLRQRLHRGLVTVNGHWPGQPKHVHSFVNPCLTDEELTEGRQFARTKRLSTPLRLLYVGRLEEGKGAGRALEILACLGQLGLFATLDLAGDGPERLSLERRGAALGIGPRVKFHGWLPRPALAPLYARSHLMVFPSGSEGWPKVLSEAMAYGVVPVSSQVGSIAQYLHEFGTGKVFEPEDVEGFTRAILWYSIHPEEWKRESNMAVQASERFGYARYLKSVCEMLGMETCN
jgi:glycosyltransferase involved in cell wall biosynthesis